ERLPLLDTIDYLSVGDYDGDGILEFAVGCHSDPTLNTESVFDSRHWLYRIYKTVGDNSYEAAWEQAFFGFQSPADFDSGVSSGDVDNDGHPELLINIFPDFYLVDFDITSSAYRVAWHAQPNRSNQAIVADFDNNGANEFFFNDGQKVIGHQYITGFSGPLAPLGFKARPLDVNLIELAWQPAGPFDAFRVYRGTRPDDLALLEQTRNQVFSDSTVSAATDYWYTVTAVDSSLTPLESLPAPLLKVRPGAKPFVESAAFLIPNQIRLVFSEPMDKSVKDQTNFKIEGIGTPSSSTVHKSGKEVILSSPPGLGPGAYTVSAEKLFDLDGTPIDTSRNSAGFVVPVFKKAPYLVKAVFTLSNQLSLEFNEPMDAASVTNVENYIIQPAIPVAEATLSPEDPRTVVLQVDSNSPIRPFGIRYFVRVRNVKSQDGESIVFGFGDTVALLISSTDLEHVFAYPNPFRSDSGQDFVTIAGLTAEAKIRILDISGRVIRTLEETNGDGGVRWDLKDESGNQVSSGIYLYYIVNGTQKATGKLAVVR
ncbi:MAG: T9SS type A sorting domain-containing protein, partial [bacterium]